MADDQATIRAASLARLRTSQQIEFAGGRSSSGQSSSWRTEFGSEAPSGSVANSAQRLQQALDQQHGSWQIELGDPAPSFYGDAQFQSARDLITALGGDSAVAGFWDYRYALYGLSGVVDAWGDIRGGNAAALIGSGSGRPVCGAGGLTFNGTTHFLRALGGLQAITGSCGCILITRGTSVPDRREWELSVDAATSILSGTITSGPVYGVGAATTPLTQSAPTASARIFHARRTVTVDTASRLGSGAETASASATGGVTANRFTLGGSRNDTPTLFSGLTDLKAVILLAGVYTPAQVALINAWAQTAHGAILTA